MSTVIFEICFAIGIVLTIVTLIGILYVSGSHWSEFCIEWTKNVKGYKNWSLISDVLMLTPMLLLSLLFIGLGSIYFLTKGDNDEQTNYQQDRGPAVEACRQSCGAGTHCTCACHGDPDTEVRRNP